MQFEVKPRNDIKILVIDDSVTTCELVKDYLSPQKFRAVDVCLSAEEAKKTLQLDDKNLLDPLYDLIILDIHLDQCSGVDLCRLLRRHVAYKDTPILIVTADQSLLVLEQSYGAGATDYIIKPFSKIELLVRLNQALKSYMQNIELRNLAHFDSLTKLTNRMLLLDRCNRSIERCHREELQFAVIFIDLNDFKQLNDTLGHAAGDKALVHLAGVLKNSIRSTDTAARFAGDEFVILAENIKTENDINILLERIYKGLEKPLKVADSKWAISISHGVSIYPRDGRSTDMLLDVADQRMYTNKQSIKQLSRLS